MKDVYLNDCVFRCHDKFHFSSGLWRIREPLQLKKEDLSFCGEQGTVFTAAIPLRICWRYVGDGIYAADIHREKFDVLLVDHKPMRMARYPKFDPDTVPGGTADNVFAPARTNQWKSPEGAFLHTLHGALSEPGEWCRVGNTLYLYPPEGIKPDCHTSIETVSAETLLSLKNCRNISFHNIEFWDTARTFMKTTEPLLRSDWKIHRGGAVFVEDSCNIEFHNCSFRNLGGNALFFSGACRNCRIESTHIRDCGASGVVFCGKPDAVKGISADSGPASENYPAYCTVKDCLIHDTGTVEKQSAGVQIEISSGITVSHCSIYHVPRAAVDIGSGCFGGHVIRDCDLFDTV